MLLFEVRKFPTPPMLRLLFEPEQYFFSVLEIYCFRVGLCQLRLPIISCLNLDCVFCVNATENEERLLFTDVRVKRLRYASNVDDIIYTVKFRTPFPFSLCLVEGPNV